VRVCQATAISGAAAVALVLVGFVRFISPPAAETNAAQTDAIVVLTGGDLRLQSGIELMRAGKGRVLFVSGVNPRVDLDQLLRSAGEKSSSWLICCTILGHEAENTFGNALETARWMHGQQYHSLRLVTAWYHLPRSLLEFRRAMPDLQIIPHPVFVEEGKLQISSGGRNKTALLAGEYAKYLAALFVPFVEPAVPGGLLRISAEAQR
jgi:uncharacterized SAM-binding protein YcdF (DUF218 family)